MASGFDLTAAERAGMAPPEVREAALRAAVGQAITGDRINVDPIFAGGDAQAAVRAATRNESVDPEFATAEARANEVAEVKNGDPLKTATEEADLAIADADAVAKRLDAEEAHAAALEEADELVNNAERWAKAAEAATSCLLRGG